ncbi:AAA family ATPase [Bacillus firmus]|uniref:AAA family ATPase n=1 Tax=Cytobacillus firmus TaxID=1399 RepID=UPI001580A029|nr:AAA family ATPase [Cytobacillus firmus]NUH84756.1 AAA family ATPase [Cytobacillus firmus]
MADIISFYSVAHSQGKKTLSLTFANLLAEHNHKVLYVELDYKKPSVALSTQISDQSRNVKEYFQDTLIKNSYDVEPYVLKRDQLLNTEDRNLRKLYNGLPSKLDYLIFPLSFQESSFPTLIEDQENAELEAQEFIGKFIYSLKTTKYEYVILSLPTELHSIFGFEVLANSDQIINVVTPSATRLFENKNAKTFLSSNIQNLEDKWHTVLNMTSEEVDENEYLQLVKGEPIFVPFDPQRQKEEFALHFGSEMIQEKLEQLALKLNISITLTTPKKRSIFSRR